MTNDFLMKIAGRASDAVGYTSGLMLGGLPTAAGAVMGMADDPGSKQQVGDAVNSNKGVLPGVGAYNMEQINNRVAKDYEEATGNKSSRMSEAAGKHTSIGLLAALGALLGGAGGFYLNKKDSQDPDQKATWDSIGFEESHADYMRNALPRYVLGGAGLGAGAGALLGGGANVLGAALAGLTGTRTKEEQNAAENDQLKNLLVPGMAEYNDWKRLGHGYDKYQQAHNTAFDNAQVSRSM